jgi:hypothetical protein
MLQKMCSSTATNKRWLASKSTETPLEYDSVPVRHTCQLINQLQLALLVFFQRYESFVVQVLEINQSLPLCVILRL